jgi:hypothetical protein
LGAIKDIFRSVERKGIRASMVRRTTSIKINDHLWRAAKHRCVDDRILLSEYLEWLIARDLAFCDRHDPSDQAMQDRYKDQQRSRRSIR